MMQSSQKGRAVDMLKIKRKRTKAELEEVKDEEERQRQTRLSKRVPTSEERQPKLQSAKPTTRKTT